MKKCMLSLIFILCFLTLVGCSSGGTNGKLPISRELNIKDDVIKFYGFDWLTELKDIEDKFNKDFSGKPFVVEGSDTNGRYSIDDKLGRYNFYIKGKDRPNLDWDIAGNELEYIELDFVSDDGGKTCYLYAATYNFKEKTGLRVKELISKLDGLYDKLSEEYDNGVITAIYSDKNNNMAVLNCYSGSERIVLSYGCKEVADTINKLETEYYMNMQNKENNDTKGL